MLCFSVLLPFFQLGNLLHFPPLYPTFYHKYTQKATFDVFE